MFGEIWGSLVGAAGRGGAGAMVAAGTVVNTALLLVVLVVVVVVVAATVGGVGEAAIVGETGGVALVILRRGATGGIVGLAVWTGPSVGGVRPWPEAPRAKLSSRSRGHTPILPLRCEIGINHSFAVWSGTPVSRSLIQKAFRNNTFFHVSAPTPVSTPQEARVCSGWGA